MDSLRPDAEAEPQGAQGSAITEHDRQRSLIAVGIGASAGGLEAIGELLRHLPPTTGMAFVIVQHLDPHHQSALPEILSGKTGMRVIQVQRETAIEPDHVYIIPPNTQMLVRDCKLILEARPPIDRFKPIDLLFCSLAEEFGFQAVGVVLSGTASDGTLGLKAIRAEGGITFAQNQTAKFDSMPRSAINAGVVDFVLSPRRIAEELAAISQRAKDLNGAAHESIRDGTTLRRVLLMVRDGTGVDFTQYKQPTVLRRLNRRLIVRKCESLKGYLELLQKDSEEVRALFDDLLISVTDFFRDPQVFEAAKRVAFPSVIRDRKQPYAIRAWIPGCSSGEEVYSMAIALVEFLESEDLEFGVQIFGTDISEGAIEKARAAIYDESSLANVSPERLRRFFVRTESGYQISRAIREMCIFSRHNVAKDPPLSRMDVVSCRNLLIYFSPALQQRIIATFGYALQPNGCLILGPSETLGNLSDQFLALDESHKIYGRKANGVPLAVTSTEDHEEDLSNPARLLSLPRKVEIPDTGRDVHKHVNKIVLSRYGPAGLVVTEGLRIIEYRGDVDPYLIGARREPDADLMTVARPDMRASLSTAIEQARRTNAAVVAENISAPDTDGPAPLSITVVPLALAGVAPHFLILFGNARQAAGDEAALKPAEAEEAVPLTAEQENSRLKQELTATREYLQSVIEELRSTNEEAQSANEELQSTNEELQTSKEELQSANEELNTINAEMQSRNVELATVNDDLRNLLDSMNIPILMTGSDLRIRRFTPMAEKVLRLIPSDINRPITDLKPRINVPDLEEILKKVIDTLQPHEREVQDDAGRLYLMRVRPYKTADRRIDGAVLQLLDVSELRLEEVKHSRDYAEAIVNTVREPLVVLDQNLTIQNANRAFYNAVGMPEAATPGQISIYEVAGGRFDFARVRTLFEKLDGGSTQSGEVDIEYQEEDGELRTLSLNARRLQTPDQKRLILMASEDITDRKRDAEARYRRLFESARDGIVLVDATTGEIIDLNPFTERLLGYSRAELVGRRLWEVDAMRSRPKVLTAMDQIRDRGAMRFDELTLRRKDGQDLQAEVIGNVYSEGDRRAIQFNIRDVSERKKFERELQETQKLESLGLLAGGIAHDFNNLLTGIMGNASLVYAELLPDQPSRRWLREVVQAAERAAFLTRQMLAYAGKGRFVVESIDLGELIGEISALIQTSIPKTVELKLNLAPDLPPIEADAAQIQQVVMNLVINGAEAVGEDTPGEVEVKTYLRELDAREANEFFRSEEAKPGTYVQLEVKDTGSGMDEATKARIFDPFFTTKFTGRGLGLAAVQGIIKGHRGAIRVYSTPGEGTTFLILVPARRRKAAAVPIKPMMASIPSGSVALVIDDEAALRLLANNVLSRAGMKVLVAANGKTGVEMFREHKDTISVVVLDLLMPVMGGEQALGLIKQMNPDVPVVLSSGFDRIETMRRFSERKPAHFLQKPYTAGRLIEAVAAALKTKTN